MRRTVLRYWPRVGTRRPAQWRMRRLVRRSPKRATSSSIEMRERGKPKEFHHTILPTVSMPVASSFGTDGACAVTHFGRNPARFLSGGWSGFDCYGGVNVKEGTYPPASGRGGTSGGSWVSSSVETQ